MENESLTPDEDRVIAAMRANPEIEACFLEMIDTAYDRSEELNNGDDAEEAVVNVIHKTGRALLQEWMERKAQQAEQLGEKNEKLRPHEKKSHLANFIGEDCNDSEEIFT